MLKICFFIKYWLEILVKPNDVPETDIFHYLFGVALGATVSHKRMVPTHRQTAHGLPRILTGPADKARD